MIQSIELADKVLSILLKNPERISRDLLVINKLDKSIFIFDKGQQMLYDLIVSASYLGKAVNETLIDSYAIKHSLTEDQITDLKVSWRRSFEESLPFSELKDVTFVYLNEYYKHSLQQLLISTNKILTEKEQDVRNLALTHKEKLIDIFNIEQDISSKTMKSFGPEFLERWNNPMTSQPLYYGFPGLDKATGGALPGELHNICAYTGEGKSMTLLKIIYFNAIYESKNMAILSLEMPYYQYYMRLLSLHSRNEKWGSRSLEYKKIKDKELTEDEKDFLAELVEDLTNNDEYGNIHFVNHSGSITPEELFDELDSVNKVLTLHEVGIDYIALMSGKGSNEQQRIANNFKTIKKKAISFDNGRGLPVFNVHQINEQSRSKAEESGKYDFNFLADTTEVKKSSDCLIWLLRTEAHKEVHEIGGGLSKLRDGEGNYEFSLLEEFKFCNTEWIDSELSE